MTNIAPDELIDALQRLSVDNPKNETIAESVASVFEGRARNLLTNWGYGIDQYTRENGSQEAISSLWLNEAVHIQGCGDPELECAGLIIREHAELKYHMKESETEKATLSISNIITAGLLFNDWDQQRRLKAIQYELMSSKAELAVEIKNRPEAGGRLRRKRTEKEDRIKAVIREKAKPVIERGTLLHHLIAKQIYDSGVAGNLGAKFVRNTVKTLCRDMGRTDLIYGLRGEK